MSEYVVHWPAMGIENGEFVGAGEELIEDDVSRRVLYTAGVVAAFLAPVVLGLAALGGVLVLDSTVGLEVVGGSALGALMVAALGVTVADVAFSRVGLSPIDNIAGVVAMTLILPFAAVYLLLRRQSGMVRDADELAMLAGEGGTWSFIASRLFKRRPRRPLTDGGEEESR